MSKDDEYIAEMEAEIEQLKAADYATWAKAAEEENTRLRALNAEMLGVLVGVVEAEGMRVHDRVVSETKFNRAWAAVHAAIAKAKGAQ